MPKVVDHEQRRREIADAVSRLAREQGLQSVTFRQVAKQAGVSVALIQHYFGSKEGLLFGTLEIQSRRFAERIGDRLAHLPHGGDPKERLSVIATSFIPTDDQSRAAMLLYHSFAGAALTDPNLRKTEAFQNSESLIAAMSNEIAALQASERTNTKLDPTTEATTILSLVLGLSLATLLDQTQPEQALDVLHAHLDRL